MCRGIRQSLCSTPLFPGPPCRGSTARRRRPSCRWRAWRDGSAGRAAEADHIEEGDLGHDYPATQPDDREFAPGDELISEGPGDPEQLAGFGHRKHKPIGADRSEWLKAL